MKKILFFLLFLSALASCVPAYSQGVQNDAFDKVATGTNSYSVTINAITAAAPYNGQKIWVLFPNANTGASTLRVNGAGSISYTAAAITLNGAALVANDILANVWMELTYYSTGTSWQLSRPGAGAGTVTNVTATSPITSSGGATPNIALTTVPVTLGGTGITTANAYGVIFGGTAPTGIFQSLAPGSSGQALISTGASSLPSWQTLSAASVNAWALDGNTVVSEKWIGTIDNFAFPIRTNNVVAATFQTDGDLNFASVLDGVKNNDNNLISFGGLGATTNIAAGSNALGRATASIECVGVGYEATYGNAALTGVTGVGYKAMNAMTGLYSTGVGWQSGLAATGQYVTLLGANSGVNLTTGLNNTFAGTGSGQGISTGNYNSIFGGISVAFPNNSNQVSMTDGDPANALGTAFYYTGNNGYFGIGTFSNSGGILFANNAKLHVVGVGSTTVTNTAEFHNSTGSNNALVIRDDGFVGLGAAAPQVDEDFHIAGNTLSPGHFSLGNTVVHTPNTVLEISETNTGASGTVSVRGVTIGVINQTSVSVTATTTRGLDINVSTNTAENVAANGFMGANISMFASPTQTGTIADAISLNIGTPNISGASPDPATIYGVKINNQGNSGTTDSYALHIAAQSNSTNNYGFVSLDDLNGFGTATPAATLHIAGASGSTLRIVDGNQAAGFVLTSDTDGDAIWQAPTTILSKTNVTQITSATTSVTVGSGTSGIITTVSETLAAGASATFTVGSGSSLTTSIIQVTIQDYSGTFTTNGLPIVTVDNITNGTFDIVVSNAHLLNALSGTLQISYIIN